MTIGMPSANRLVLVLDRDGTLNVEKNYLSDPADLELFPDTLDALSRLGRAGWRFVVVTNQSGVGRGYFAASAVDAVHARLRDLLSHGGVDLDGIYVCPHGPSENCPCRKPLPGLIRQAERDLGFDAATAVVVGDKASDIALGRAVGARTILVTQGYGRETLAKWNDRDARPDFVAGTLTDAADWLGAPPSAR